MDILYYLGLGAWIIMFLRADPEKAGLWKIFCVLVIIFLILAHK